MLNSSISRIKYQNLLFQIRTDDNLPKAICHECLQQISALHLYTIKVDKTQKFLEFHKMKMLEEKRDVTNDKTHPITAPLTFTGSPDSQRKLTTSKAKEVSDQQGDCKPNKQTKMAKKKTASELKFMEAMPLEEFASSEKVDTSLLSNTALSKTTAINLDKREPKNEKLKSEEDYSQDSLDPIVLVDGRPAKQGAALDRQITLFYKMECCICHESGFHFRSLMKHYKERHGVPGYVTCCDKKFHYFYPKKIIEHMAYHLQDNIFM